MGSRAALDDVQWQAANCTVESRGIAGSTIFDTFGEVSGTPRGDCTAQGRRLTGMQSGAVPRRLQASWQRYNDGDVYVPWLEVAVGGQSHTRCLYRWGMPGCFAMELWGRATDFYYDHPEGTAIQCFDDAQGGHLATRAEGAPSGGNWLAVVLDVVWFFIPCLCCIPCIWLFSVAVFLASLVRLAGCAPSDDSSESGGSTGVHDDDEHLL